MWALYVVLPQCIVARKVKATIVADPVGVGIILMLLKARSCGNRRSQRSQYAMVVVLVKGKGIE